MSPTFLSDHSTDLKQGHSHFPDRGCSLSSPGVQFICCSVKPAVPGHHHSQPVGQPVDQLTPWCGSNNPCSPVSKHCSLGAAESGKRGSQGSLPRIRRDSGVSSTLTVSQHGRAGLRSVTMMDKQPGPEIQSWMSLFSLKAILMVFFYDSDMQMSHICCC